MLMSTDELARGLLILTCGSAAGAAALAFPGSAAWLLPAALGMAGASLTIPEVRAEVRKSLPGLVDQARAGLPIPRLPGRGSGRSAGGPDGPEPEPKPEPRDPLFAALEDSPHRLVIGHTGGGKTTLMHSMAVGWAANKERVLVLDPDAAPGQWPGCTVRGAGDDYAGISQGLAAVDREVERRRLARAEGCRQFAPAHIVIDEAQDVIAECPEAMDVIESIARRGRKINMRLTMGVQDNQAKTLGIEGKTHLLRNLQTVDVMLQDGRRVAVVHRPGGKETMPIPDLYDPEQFIVTRQRGSAPVQSHSPAPEDLLQSLLGVSKQGVTMDTASHASPRARHGGVSMDTGMDTGTMDTGVTMDTPCLDTPPTVRIEVNAHAEVAPSGSGGGVGRRRSRLPRPNIARMKQRAEEARAKQALRAAYAQRKAAGESYRKAYAELGGNSQETRAWWREGATA